MKGQFLINSNEVSPGGNIYADKSALILYWLLQKGVDKKEISIREVAKEAGVSVGLVQRVFNALILDGILQSIGIRTAKKFFLKNPNLLSRIG